MAQRIIGVKAEAEAKAMESASRFSLTEYDEAGALVASYVPSLEFVAEDNATFSGGDRGGGAAGKRKPKFIAGTDPMSVGQGFGMRVLAPPTTKPTVQKILDVFLPAGYPQSVGEDYLMYQVYDSLQAFSSSIAGLIASRAVLEGVGVGDPTTTPTTALLLSIFQDSLGRLATILYAAIYGLALEPECKKYRLLADVFNDAAMVLDCLSPGFPKSVRVAVLAGGSVLRSLCGVAAGSSKASLSAHFARKGNLGEVNAKDSSQETVISLVGMLAGSLIVPRIVSPIATWMALISLLCIHLGTNYLAVRAVSMRSLNRQRANIVFSSLFESGKALTPPEVSAKERIFENGSILRWTNYRTIGHCRIGVPFSDLVSLLEQRGRGGPEQLRHTRKVVIFDPVQVLGLFDDEKYILWYDPITRSSVIVLKRGAKPTDQLKAWAHALLVAKQVDNQQSSSEMNTEDGYLAVVTRALDQVKKVFPQYERQLQLAGWDLEVGSLETRSGVRVVYERGKKSL